jgi:RIO-like serine/threonine protein kinase
VLQRLHRAGVPCPKPLHVNGKVCALALRSDACLLPAAVVCERRKRSLRHPLPPHKILSCLSDTASTLYPSCDLDRVCPLSSMVLPPHCMPRTCVLSDAASARPPCAHMSSLTLPPHGSSCAPVSVVAVCAQVLVMSLVGAEGNPAPTLGSVDLTPSNTAAAYLQVVDAMYSMWHRAGLVHADLNESNIL